MFLYETSTVHTTSLHLNPKRDKLPLHHRGRILLAYAIVAWMPIAGIAWYVTR